MKSFFGFIFGIIMLLIAVVPFIWLALLLKIIGVLWRYCVSKSLQPNDKHYIYWFVFLSIVLIPCLQVASYMGTHF